jgi:DNA-binding transcriptional MerR regulator
MFYTVKQLADLAGVSIRTLHYYGDIGILKPTSYGENGYRYIALIQRVERLNRLIKTLDKTILHLRGKLHMEQKEFFEGFSDEKQQEYLQEIRERYGDRSVRETLDRWNSYMPEQKEAITASGEAIFRGICDHIVNGYDSPEVQQLIKALHKHMGFFL